MRRPQLNGYLNGYKETALSMTAGMVDCHNTRIDKVVTYADPRKNAYAAPRKK